MKEGVLIYDFQQERIDIRFGLEEYYGGLHCGECFEVMIDERWEPVRIEMGEDWYLIGNNNWTLGNYKNGYGVLGLKARI